jgi:RNA polymerase sigma-70 factor (ECF subfamily)
MSGDSGSHSELVERLRQGDRQALANLFSHYRERLKRMVALRMDRRLQGRTDPSDILQEAYIDAHQRVRHYLDKPRMSFFLWLRQVAMQRLIDVHRRHLGARMRDARQEVSLYRGDVSAVTSASMAVQLVGHLTSPSQHAARAELIDQVEDALQHMAPMDREVLVLRHFEELSNNDIAELLGITKAAASNRYVRALARLRAALAIVSGSLDDANGE